MLLKEYLVLNNHQLNRIEELKNNYKAFYEEPENATPLFIINVPKTPLGQSFTTQEMLDDPLIMLQSHLDAIKPHIEMEDDYVPAVRVNFGTAQIPAAFGCELFIPEKDSPAAKTHVMKEAEDIYNMNMPSIDAGWFVKLEKFTKVFLENLPEGIEVQHPDIQSPFNSAVSIRGNDIMFDFYDNPKALEKLLDMITDYMIKLVPHLKAMISTDKEWFLDWGAMWKGAARISNCSMQMIDPKMYLKYVLPRDLRLMSSIGGGRIHYCGTSRDVINEFFKNPYVTGLDYEGRLHDLWDLCESAPEKLTLFKGNSGVTENVNTINRLLSGDWPKKRNIVIQVDAKSVEEGKDLLRRLRESVSTYLKIRK